MAEQSNKAPQAAQQEAVATGDELRRRALHQLVAPSGLKYTVRAVTNWDLVRTGQIAVLQGVSTTRGRVPVEQAPAIVELWRQVLVVAVVQPRLSDRRAGHEPQGEVSVDLLPTGDGDYLVAEVMRLSGFGPAAEERLAPFSATGGSS